MSLTLTPLGTSGSYAGPGNPCSGYLVRSPGATVVVDLGPGTLANLQLHVPLDRLDAVVLTHEHADHWLDLSTLHTGLKYYLGGEGLPVHGPPGVGEAARALIGSLEPTFRWGDLDPASVLTVGDQRLRFSRTDHPVETLAVRVEAAGRTLAYTADTGSGWAPGDFLAGVDLLLCEATLPASHEDQSPHLTGRQAGALARDTGAGRLVLTHVAPVVDAEGQRSAAARAFGAPVELGEVGVTLTV